MPRADHPRQASELLRHGRASLAIFSTPGLAPPAIDGRPTRPNAWSKKCFEVGLQAMAFRRVAPVRPTHSIAMPAVASIRGGSYVRALATRPSGGRSSGIRNLRRVLWAVAADRGRPTSTERDGTRLLDRVAERPDASPHLGVGRPTTLPPPASVGATAVDARHRSGRVPSLDLYDEHVDAYSSMGTESGLE